MTMRILVVDDDEDLAESTSEYLADCGYRTEAVFDGYKAYKRIVENGFNAIVMDVRMPGMSGVDVLRAIRKTGSAIPVIMVTGYTIPDVLGEAEALGVERVLEKPVDLDSLGALLNSLGNC